MFRDNSVSQPSHCYKCLYLLWLHRFHGMDNIFLAINYYFAVSVQAKHFHGIRIICEKSSGKMAASRDCHGLVDHIVCKPPRDVMIIFRGITAEAQCKMQCVCVCVCVWALSVWALSPFQELEPCSWDRVCWKVWRQWRPQTFSINYKEAS